jgi:transposase-like protein
MQATEINVAGRVVKRITRHEAQQMRTEYEAGDTIEAIAARYGRAFSSVHGQLVGRTRLRSRSEALRSYTPTQEKRILTLMAAPGATKAEVAHQVGVSVYAVRRVLARKDAPPPPVLRIKPKRKQVAPDPTQVPTAPLLAAIHVEILRRARQLEQRMFVATDKRLSARSSTCVDCGISPKTLYNWEHGIHHWVAFNTADRVLLGLGLLWWEVYDPADATQGVFRPRQRDDVLAWLDVADRLSRLWDGEVLLGPDDPVLEAERVAALEWAA